MNTIERAALFARAAHAAVGQVRKYTGEPYHVHCEDVAKMVAAYCSDDTKLIAAAHLHDVLEDTRVTADFLRAEFGDEITTLVLEVTDVSRPKDGNRAERKAIDRAHLSKASARGKTLKLADLINNTGSISKHDPDFAKVYVREKWALLLGPLTGSSSPRLYDVAVSVTLNAAAGLGVNLSDIR